MKSEVAASPAAPLGEWGQPCIINPFMSPPAIYCLHDLVCNKPDGLGICQQPQDEGVEPRYGSLCQDNNYCSKNAKADLVCTDDFVTAIPAPSGHLTRCGCDAKNDGRGCGGDDDASFACVANQKQSWQKIAPPPASRAPRA